MSAKVSPKPNSSSGRLRSAISFGRMTILGAVMTDKATVEIPSPVEGEVLWLGAEVGDVIPVGSELVRLKVAGEDSRSATGEAQNVPVAKAPTVKEARYVRSATPRIGDLRAHARAATARPSFTTDKPAQTASAATVCPWSSASRRRKALGRTGGSSEGARGGSRLATSARLWPGRPNHARGPGCVPRSRREILREWPPFRRRPL